METQRRGGAEKEANRQQLYGAKVKLKLCASAVNIFSTVHDRQVDPMTGQPRHHRALIHGASVV